MSFDFRTFCPAEPTGRKSRIARVLLPVGAMGCLLPATPPWAALLGGAVLALTLGNPCAAMTARTSKWLLQVAVVGLGAGVNLAIVLKVGSQGLGYTLVSLLISAGMAIWLARQLVVAPKIAALIGAGTGICGGSAIAAIAPAIQASVAETSAALATVFLLNGAALLVFPAVGTWLALDPHTFGLWCALAIHDTSSVTGAAMTAGPVALATATTVKLARALWIVPVAFGLGFWFSAGRRDGRRQSLRLPWFIAGFIVVSAAFTLLPSLQPGARYVTGSARAALTLTLFLIGTGLDRAVVRSVGIRPFLHGLILWALVAAGTLAALLAGWIR